MTYGSEREWERFHDPKSLDLTIAGQVGELSELFQWLPATDARDRAQEDPLKSRVAEEMADVLLALVRLADVLGIDLHDAAVAKIEAAGERFAADEVRGTAPTQNRIRQFSTPSSTTTMNGLHSKWSLHLAALWMCVALVGSIRAPTRSRVPSSTRTGSALTIRTGCAGCDRRVSAIAGTIFHATRAPLAVWFLSGLATHQWEGPTAERPRGPRTRRPVHRRGLPPADLRPPNRPEPKEGTTPETLDVLVHDRYQRDRVVRALDRDRDQPGRPVVMTMHRAKGTEFAKVVLVGVGAQTPAEAERLAAMDEAEHADA
jgi:NTP pyrophosphatase (non-canonical NTP hydrolase)